MNILQQEQEFLKLNAEIDFKTKNLLDEVDQMKEIQSKNDKLFLEWEAPDANSGDDTVENEKGRHELHSSIVSSQDNFRSKSENEIPESVDQVESAAAKVLESLQGKKNIRRSLNAKSAKAALMSTVALGQDPKGPLELAKPKWKHNEMDYEVIPETLKGVGREGITKFLEAKIKLLVEQMEMMQKDEKIHLERIRELQSYKDNSVEEQDKLIHQANLTRNALMKYEQQAKNSTVQLQNLQSENGRLKKELEILKKEMRESNKNSNANEKRLSRALEEVEKLKSSLQQMKQEEKELKEIHRHQTEEMSNTLRRIDRQRNELLNGFKKQLLVIDNLKKQKGLIEASKLLKCAEEDFINFLDSNPPNKGHLTDIKSIRS